MNITHLNDWQYGRVYDITTDPKRAKQVLKRKPRTRMIASECISIMPDGTRKLIASPKRKGTYKRLQNRLTAAERTDMINAIDARLHGTTAGSLAPIGNID